MEAFRSALDKTFNELYRLMKEKKLKPNYSMIEVTRFIYLALKDAYAKNHKCCEENK